MPSNEPDGRAVRQRKLAISAILAGVLFTGLSFWPEHTLGDSGWSTEQALRYQEASAKLIGMSHPNSGPSPEAASKMSADESRESFREYSKLREQLDSARGRTVNWAIVLRTMGIVLAIVGAATYFAALRE